ncbi:unnamed protein product [Closterium sp. Yama58-4]|nr:unnamed protein product [Closterium sp. Yama58-4]
MSGLEPNRGRTNRLPVLGLWDAGKGREEMGAPRDERSIEPARIASRNLGSFISNVTPRVKLQYINKELERFSHPGRHESSTCCAFYTLGDLWDSLEEWSAFGAGVPIQLANGTHATQYYVPSISGLQLYARSSSWQLPESRNSGPDSDCSDVSFHDSSSDSSESSDRNEGRGVDGAAKAVEGCVMESSVDGAWGSKIHASQSHMMEELLTGLDGHNSVDECAAVSWDSCQDCNGGRLLLEFYERAPPHVRLPLFSKVEELEREFPCLRHLSSIDLHPRSWMAIAWYPLYKIPAGPSVRDLGASFLTFHSLSSPGPSLSGSCVRCNDEYWISPMKLPQSCMFSPPPSSHEEENHAVHWSGGSLARISTTALAPFGFTSYKASGSLWSDRWCIQGLEAAAEQWLRHINSFCLEASAMSLPSHLAASLRCLHAAPSAPRLPSLPSLASSALHGTAFPADVDAIIARGREAGAFVEHSACVVPGAADGPLRGLTFAVKDMYDVAGVPTGFGNPTWLATHDVPHTTAPVVQALLEAGATLVGKAAMDELAFSLAGENAHYGTPLNPKAPLRIPGGSSSGSAAAVAAGLVDFALGSDTAGSVRIPANHCGVWGIRSSHARLPLTGAQPLQPSMDAAVVGGRPEEIVVAGEEGSEVGSLHEWVEAMRVLQLMEAWQCHGQWITEHRPAFGPGVAQRFHAASAVDPQGEAVAQAREKRAKFTSHVESLVAGGKLLMLPAAPSIAPLKAAPPADVDSFRVRTLALTVIGGAAGLPQVKTTEGLRWGCGEG